MFKFIFQPVLESAIFYPHTRFKLKLLLRISYPSQLYNRTMSKNGKLTNKQTQTGFDVLDHLFRAIGKKMIKAGNL